MPPPLLMGPRALPAQPLRARWPGPEPPSRQGAASESSPGSSASPLSFEIEFGLGEGGSSPPCSSSTSQAGSGPSCPAFDRQNWWARAGLLRAWAEALRMAEHSREDDKDLHGHCQRGRMHMASASLLQPKMDVATHSLPHHLVSQQEWVGAGAIGKL